MCMHIVVQTQRHKKPQTNTSTKLTFVFFDNTLDSQMYESRLPFELFWELSLKILAMTPFR